MEPNTIYETYLKQISSRLSGKDYKNALNLCVEMKARLYANSPVNPALLGWQRYYHFLSLVKLEKDKEALDLYLSREEQPYLLDYTQSNFMTSVSAELACARNDVALTLKLSRLAWALTFNQPDPILRIQKAQNACIYFERLNMNRLNFGFARFLTGFGKANDVPALYIQGLECLASNYRQSASLTIAAVLLNSLPNVLLYLQNPPSEIPKLRITELVEHINKIPTTITISGKFDRAAQLIENNQLMELLDLIKENPLLVNENDDNGETLIYKAVAQSNLSAVQMLLELDADLHRSENQIGNSPILGVIETGNIEIAKILLEAGADPESRDNNGESAIIKAVIEDRIEVLTLLLEYGAILDRRDERGYTALMHAVTADKLPMVKALLSAGANPTVKSLNNESMLDLARKTENLELVTIFDDFEKMISKLQGPAASKG